MSSLVDQVSEWNMGDAVREIDSSRVGKVSEIGTGESVFVRKPNGEIEYENQGDGRVCSLFVEHSKKIKQAKKWVVVPGMKESFRIDKLSTEFENESYLVRNACAEKEAEADRNERWPSPIPVTMSDGGRVYDSAKEFGSIDNNDQVQDNSDDDEISENDDGAADMSALSGTPAAPAVGAAASEVT